MEPEPGWTAGVHLHWDDDAGWLEIPLGDYCPACGELTGRPQPGSVSIIGLDDDFPDEDRLICLRCVLGPDVCLCGLRQGN